MNEAYVLPFFFSRDRELRENKLTRLANDTFLGMTTLLELLVHQVRGGRGKKVELTFLSP